MTQFVLHLVDENISDCELSLMKTGLQDGGVIAIGGKKLLDRVQSFELPIVSGESLNMHPVFSLPAIPGSHFKGSAVIHTWSVATCMLALLKNSGRPIVLSLTRDISDSQIGWLRECCRVSSRIAVLCHSDTLRGRLITSGVNSEAVHLLRPGLTFSEIARKSRDALRSSWAMTEALVGDTSMSESDRLEGAEGMKVLGVLCDQPSQLSQLSVGALLLLIHRYLLSEDEQAQAQLTVVLPERVDRAYQHRLGFLLRNLSAHQAIAKRASAVPGQIRVVLDKRMTRPWEILPGMDAALYWNDGNSLSSTARDSLGKEEGEKGQGHCQAASGLSVLWAMAAQVPVAGQMSYELCEWMEDKKSAFLVPPGADWKLAQAAKHALGVPDEPAGIDDRESWKRADQARSDAFNYLSASRYKDDLKRVYGQLIEGQPVEVPQVMGKPAMMFGH